MIRLDEIQTKLEKQGKYWIVFTGDSITSCEWVHPNWRDIVVYVLQEEMTKHLNGDWKTSEWGIRGFNFAYDGATTTDILAKIDNLVLVEPDLVIGLMGGNDPTIGVSVEQSVTNISAIVDRVYKTGAKVVWCNSTPAGSNSKKNAEYQPYAEAFMAMPDQAGLQKIDMFEAYQEFPLEKIFTFISEENPVEGVKAGEIDLQHPNQLGNAYIAKLVLREVFGVEFDPQKYIEETLVGKKYPEY